MTVIELDKVNRRYRRLKRKVEAQLRDLQQQRQQQLAPSRLYLPIPWQPIVYEQPVAMYKIVAAQGGQFTSVFDSRVVYQLQQWTYARCGCSSGVAWPPLWSCIYAFPTAKQARSAVFPRGSQQQKGARVLCQVTVQGKGYVHPDGRVAVSCLRLDGLLEYLPKGPAEKVVSLDYCSPIGADSSSGGAHVAPYSSVRGTSRVQPPAVQLVASLQQAAWEVEA